MTPTGVMQGEDSETASASSARERLESFTAPRLFPQNSGFVQLCCQTTAALLYMHTWAEPEIGVFPAPAFPFSSRLLPSG